MNYPPSKLPHIGTTIFTVMSQLANDFKAVNLSQGFPDFDGPKILLEGVGKYIAQGLNQYAPMAGIPALREQIVLKVQTLYGNAVSPDEVTITSGATEALFNAISAVIHQGDEVIIFDPAYDSYEPAITLNGGKAVRLNLLPPAFKIDWQQLKDAINSKTRLIIINTPHNPTGTTLTKNDLNQLAELVRNTDILIISDEVYEHIIFDGLQHESIHRHPELYARSFVISSFGKTYHTTGWKIGYCVAPPVLTQEFRKIHQYVTFTTSTPMQYALVDVMREAPEHIEQLPQFYQTKRDEFSQLLQSTRFTLLTSTGTYFQLADYTGISNLDDVAFCRWLTTDIGVAAIPVSVFYEKPPTDMKLIRFCFAKNSQTLKHGAARLRSLNV